METSSVWNGLNEIGTVTHEGRTYEASGAIVADDLSVVGGYVKRDEATGKYYLTGWDGSFMFITLEPRGTWKTPRSYISSEMTAWRTTINGKTYAGRNGGEGLVLFLRPTVKT